MSYEKNDTLPGLSATAAMAPTSLISPKVPYVPHISNFRSQNLHNLILSPSLPLACVAPAYQYIRRLQASGQRKKKLFLFCFSRSFTSMFYGATTWDPAMILAQARKRGAAWAPVSRFLPA